jgi:hypothetical protein
MHEPYSLRRGLYCKVRETFFLKFYKTTQQHGIRGHHMLFLGPRHTSLRNIRSPTACRAAPYPVHDSVFGTGGLGTIAIEHHAQLKTTLEAAHKGVNIVLFNISDTFHTRSAIFRAFSLLLLFTGQ